MAETWSGEFYCVKCKEKREAEGEIKVNDKGTKMAKGVPFLEERERNHFLRVEPQEWQRALELLDAGRTS